MKNSNVVIIGIIAIVFAALGFFSGMKYQQTKIPSFSRNNVQGMMGQNEKLSNGTGTKNIRTGMGATNENGLRMGTIAGMDETSITLKMQDGSSKIIILAESTTYKKTAEAVKDNVQVGDTVVITGTTNTDGSITAQQIQINPAMMNALPSAPKK